MGEWKEFQISEVCSEITDCVNKTAKTVDYETPFKMIRTTNIKNGSININDVRYVTEDIYKVWTRRGELRRDDIILTREAPVGEVGILKSDEKFFLGQRTMLYRANPNLADQHFLYYTFLTNELQETFKNLGMGSVVEHIRVPDATKFVVSLPPLSEQKAIAGVLSSLDDKIDLLHRQNKTLEAMAETLFRQWFIEEAEEGWEEHSLLEMIQLVGGGTPKTSILEYWNGEIPWLSGGDIASNHRGFIITSEKKISESGLLNSSAKLLPRGATVISARGTVGKLCLLSREMAFSQSNYGVLPKVEGCYYFTYLLVLYAIEELQSSAYGSVFDTITTNTFSSINYHRPCDDQIRIFNAKIEPLFEKILNNSMQINGLSKTRDTLLPKLMSGEATFE